MDRRGVRRSFHSSHSLRGFGVVAMLAAVLGLLAGGLPALAPGSGPSGLAVQAAGSSGSVSSLPWWDPRGWFGGGGGRPESTVQAGTTLALPSRSHPRPGRLPAYGKAHVTGEVTKDRSEYSRVYRLSDGQLRQVVSAVPVNYRDSAGRWRPVKTAVTRSPQPGIAFQNTTNNFRTYFGSRTGNLAQVVVPGTGSVTIGAARTATGSGGGSGAGFTAGGGPVAAQAAGSAVSYAGLGRDLSLEYQVTPEGLQERLVLKSRAAGAGPFTFRVHVSAGLVPRRERDGAVTLLKDGAPALVIPAPVMTGARAVKSSPLGHAIGKVSQHAAWNPASRVLTVTVAPDAAWLDAPGREFPVTVDPTVEIAPTPSDAQNVMIESDLPTTNLSSSWRLSVGTTTSADVRSMLYFPLSSVPSGTVLQDADLRLYYDQTFSGTDAAEPITVDAASGAWSASTATWDSASGLDSGTQGMTQVAVDDSNTASTAANGTWASQAAASAVDGEYRYDQDTVSGDTFTWTPDLPEAGNWTTSVHYVADASAASDAPFTVNDSGGAKSYTVNEQSGTAGDGYWATLGSGQMAAGTGGTITAGDGPASSSVRVEADEARWQEFAHATVNPDTDDNVWNSFPVTNIVQSWLDGSANYGFVVKSATEGTLGQGGPRYEGSGYYYNGETATYPQLVLTWGAPGVSINPITTIGATGADLSWTPYTNPTSDPGMDLAQYEVYRSVYQSFTPDASTLISPVAAGTTSYDDTSEPPTPASASTGNAFYYMVAVRTKNGTLIPGPTRLVRLPTAGKTTVIIPASGATTLASGTPATTQQDIAGYPWLEVGNNSSYGIARAAFAFPTLASAGVPSGATVTDAHLKLWGWYNYNTGGGSATYDVNALTQSFDPATATWDDASSGTAWTTAGGTYNPTVTGSVTGLTNDPDRQNLTVTATAQDWLDGTAPQDGLLVRLASESTSTGPQERELFMNAGAAEQALAPELVVTYVNTLPADTYYSRGLPDTMTASTSYSVPVSVTNTTASTWSSADWVLSYHWLAPDGTNVTTSADQTQTALTADMAPGATEDLTADITTPPVTDGAGGDRQGYVLAWDMYDTASGTWLSSGTSTPAPSSTTTSTAATTTLGTLNQVTSVTRSASDLLGLEKYYQYTGVNTGSGTSLLTNDDTGNVVWNYNAFSNPSRGFQTFVRLDYNSLDTSDSAMGFGWSLQASTLQRLGTPLKFHPYPNPTSVTLTDGDGTTHTFTWNSSTSTWTSPPGLHYYLQQEATCDPSEKTNNARAWLMTAPDRTQFWFDCQGYQTAVIDKNGNEADFTYTWKQSNNAPVKFLDYITGPSGRQTLTLTYYHKGDSYTYVDDSTGALATGTKLTDPDIIGQVKSITAINGRTINFYYDTKGLMEQMTDGDGSAITKTFKFGYDATQGNKNVKLTSVTDPRGNTTSLAYYTAPADPHWKWSVNTITDRMNRTTTFGYTLESSGDVQAQVTDPKGNITTYTMDTSGRPVQAVNALGQTTTLGWDAGNDVTSLTEPNGAQTTWTYDDTTGYPTAMTDAQANHDGTAGTAYTYATALSGHTAELTSELTPQQRLWTFGYDANGNLTSVTKPLGNASGAAAGSYTTKYTYDSYGDLLTSTDPNGNVTKYAGYGPDGYPGTVTDPLGNTTSYAYDSTGNVTSVTDPLGNVTTRAYDVFGRPGQQVVPETSTTSITTPAPVYDANDHVTQAAAPNGAVTSYAYNADGELTAKTSPPDTSGGATPVTTYTYDADGNLATQTAPGGNASGAAAGSYTTSYGYNAISELTSVTGPLGGVTSYGYDDAGNKTSVTDPDGNQTQYAYNLNHQVTQVTDAAGNTTKTGYDLDGNVISTTDQNGNTTLYTLDADAEVTQVQVPAQAPGAPVTYDTTQYKYDQDGNRTEVISPRGVASGTAGAYTTQTQYNADSQVSAVLTPYLPGDATYGTPAKTSYSYDADGRLSAVTAPASNASSSVPNVTNYSYYDNGWVQSDTSPTGITTSYGYNPLGEQSSRVITSAGGAMSRTMNWGYYPAGNLASVSDDGVPTGLYAEVVDDSDAQAAASPAGSWTTVACTPATTSGCEGYEYQTHAAGTGTDKFTWQLDVPDAGNYTVYVKYPVVSGAATNAAYTVTYNGGSATATVTQDQAGNSNGGWISLGKWAFTQGGNGQQVTLAENSGGTVTAGAVEIVRDNSGTTNTATHAFAYTYDADGNQTGITDSSPGAAITSYAMAYDQDNRNTSVTEDNSSGTVVHTTTYGYDAASNLTSRTYDGAPSAYTYNNLNQLVKESDATSATDTSPQVSTFTYTPTGQAATETKPNGNTVTFTYYANHQLDTQTEDTSGGTLVASHAYTYNSNGDTTQDTEQVMSADHSKKYLSHTLTYTYDPMDQVETVATDGTVTESYTHNAANNVTSQTVNGATTTYGYNLGRLQTATTSGTTASYNYDPFGRLDTVTSAGQTLQTNTYNGFSKLAAVSQYDPSTGTTATTSYGYDPLNRMTSQTTTAGTSTFSYLGLSGQLVSESGPGGTSKTYDYAPSGLRLSQTTTTSSGTSTGYYSYNAHSDVQALTGANGDTTATYGYTAYGSPIASMFTGADQNNATASPTSTTQPYSSYRFNAMRWDSTTGQYDMGFRTYDPGLNQFTSRDMYNGALANMGLTTDPFTGSRYAFGGGNPISNIELNGHMPCSPGGPCGSIQALSQYSEAQRTYSAGNTTIVAPSGGALNSAINAAQNAIMAGGYWGSVRYVHSPGAISYPVYSRKAIARFTCRSHPKWCIVLAKPQSLLDKINNVLAPLTPLLLGGIGEVGGAPEDAALTAAQNEAAALRAAKAAGQLQGRLPTATAAAVDRTTGEVVGIGHSGDLAAPPAGLENVLPKPSLEPWSAWNCAEVAACGEALAGGSSLGNLVVRTVRTITGDLFPPCDNCQVWLPGR